MNDEVVNFDCSCGAMHHIMRVSTAMDDDGWTFCAFEFRLNPYLPWYRRLWVALRYVFGRPGPKCEYDAFILDVEKVGEIISILKRHKEAVRVLKLHKDEVREQAKV